MVAEMETSTANATSTITAITSTTNQSTTTSTASAAIPTTDLVVKQFYQKYLEKTQDKIVCMQHLPL
jgi:hypothetical protein